MGDLGTATTVRPLDDSTFSAELSKDWEIWGPNGGYLAAIALRTAGLATGRAVPVSIGAHFVGVSKSGPVTLRVQTNRVTKVATSVSITMMQDERPVLVASVWGADELSGIEHQVAGPMVGPPDDFASTADLLAGQPDMPTHPFWANIEQRPLDWIEDWDNREPSSPENRCWTRFTPTPTFEDRWLDACRSLILLDADAWSAATRPHPGEMEYYAPTIEVSVRFLGSASSEEWLLSVARSPAAREGLVAATGEIWSTSGRLLANGGSTLLCRPASRLARQ